MKFAAVPDTVYVFVSVAMIGTGVGGGVGGIGVGASEMGVTSNISVSLVSFMFINAVILILSVTPIRNCWMSAGVQRPSFKGFGPPDAFKADAKLTPHRRKTLRRKFIGIADAKLYF